MVYIYIFIRSCLILPFILKFMFFIHQFNSGDTKEKIQIYSEKYPENLLSLVLCSTGSGTNVVWKQTEKEVMKFNKSKSSFGQ